MADLDLETIRHALAVARQNGLSDVQLEAGGSAFSAVLAGNGVKPKPSAKSDPAEVKTADAPPSNEKPITSPCVGFYKPIDSVFVAGKPVEKGQIVATIQALGLANDVESPVAGEILEVLVAPDQAVEFGQILATVKIS